MTAVTVTWRSAAQIRGFLAACPPGMPVIVVDNASPDDTAAVARAARPEALVLENPANLGFGAGCNRGLDHVATEFALLVNPDCRLGATAIAALVAAAEAHPECRLVAPRIEDGAGQPVRSWDVAQPRRPRLRRDRRAEPWPEGRFCADFASGACLLLRPAQGLRFDEGYFLFYEDDDLCAQAGHVLVEPLARVRHAGGASSPPDAATRWRKARHMAWSRLRYASRHGGGPAAARRQGLLRLLHHAGRALGHAMTLSRGKLWTDLAGLAGTLAWLAGRR
ncbi:glycosyltransferase family 2 protein [Roseomonas sp. BU-1]|uniref:Glycosyltransferase family 2 protein n=2 Tax=Falsiroseomonas selenitidurans TaxID=2716335 RepID=A0ABX1EEM5_9PROT|nr:glycosyltransferase family 2 protein [Falsiroseomonas selenitidurans]